MPLPKLTKLELQIMEALWVKGPCSVREIQEFFPAKKRPAYTTVQTTGQDRRRCEWVRTFSLSDPVEVQCAIGGAGVPSDHAPTGTIIMVTRSSGSSDARTGEPGRSAPQLFAASPEMKNIRCGCQFMP